MSADFPYGRRRSRTQLAVAAMRWFPMQQVCRATQSEWVGNRSTAASRWAMRQQGCRPAGWLARRRRFPGGLNPLWVSLQKEDLKLQMNTTVGVLSKNRAGRTLVCHHSSACSERGTGCAHGLRPVRFRELVIVWIGNGAQSNARQWLYLQRSRTHRWRG